VSTVVALVEHVDRFAERVIQDALNEATAAYWRRRAEQTEAARSRTGDFHGLATSEEIEARDCRLAERAAACRGAAEIAIVGGRWSTC
jgi:hypothetical protein